MHSIPLCRSFEIYLNPVSTSVVELGTMDHPYKDWNSVSVELMNYYANTNSTINVYIMEETMVYWMISENYISNITSVNIKTYSSIRSDPNKANVIGIKSSDRRIAPGMPSKFHILSDKTLKFNEKIILNTALDSSEISTVSSSISILVMHRSAVSLDNFLVTTEYDVEVTTTRFFYVIQTDALQINMTNLEIVVSGAIMTVNSPIQLYFLNIKVDYYKSKFGIWVNVYCGDPVAIAKMSIYAVNMHYYFSQPRVSNLAQRHGLIKLGYGSFTLINSTFEVYGSSTDVMTVVANFGGSV